MFHSIIFVFVIVSCCTASQENEVGVSRKNPLKYPFHFHHGIIQYWVFLAIKVKIIFLIGTFISFWVLAGKAFAFLYYVSSKDKCNCHDTKVIYDDHKYGAPPLDYFQKKVFMNSPSFLHRYSTIRNPTPTQSTYGTTSNFARSIGVSLFGNMDFFKSIIKKADLTEMAFEAMHLKEKVCKMRFVCEAHQSAQNDSVLAFSLHLFSDTDFMKYRTNVTDCKTLGPHCRNF